jgi:hypothetical protein
VTDFNRNAAPFVHGGGEQNYETWSLAIVKSDFLLFNYKENVLAEHLKVACVPVQDSTVSRSPKPHPEHSA